MLDDPALAYILHPDVGGLQRFGTCRSQVLEKARTELLAADGFTAAAAANALAAAASLEQLDSSQVPPEDPRPLIPHAVSPYHHSTAVSQGEDGDGDAPSIGCNSSLSLTDSLT